MKAGTAGRLAHRPPREPAHQSRRAILGPLPTLGFRDGPRRQRM